MMVDDQFHSFSSLKWQFQIHLGIIFPVVPHVILELSPQSPPSGLRALPGGESGKALETLRLRLQEGLGTVKRCEVGSFEDTLW